MKQPILEINTILCLIMFIMGISSGSFKIYKKTVTRIVPPTCKRFEKNKIQAITMETTMDSSIY